MVIVEGPTRRGRQNAWPKDGIKASLRLGLVSRLAQGHIRLRERTGWPVVARRVHAFRWQSQHDEGKDQRAAKRRMPMQLEEGLHLLDSLDGRLKGGHHQTAHGEDREKEAAETFSAPLGSPAPFGCEVDARPGEPSSHKSLLELWCSNADSWLAGKENIFWGGDTEDHAPPH